MSMLKTTVSSQVFIANEVLAANEVGGVKGGDELIEKCGKLSKTEKLSKSKKPLALEYAFIHLRLAFTNIWIEPKVSYFFSKAIP